MWLVLLLVVVCNLPEALLMYKLASKVMNYIDRSCSSPTISAHSKADCAVSCGNRKSEQSLDSRSLSLSFSLLLLLLILLCYCLGLYLDIFRSVLHLTLSLSFCLSVCLTLTAHIATATAN